MIATVIARLRAWLRGIAGWSRNQQLAGAFGVALVAIGLAVILTHGSGHGTTALPPTPPSPSAVAPAPSTSASSSSAAAKAPASKSKSKPAPFRCPPSKSHNVGFGAVYLCIPAIGVSTNVIPLGLNADRTIQVPPLSEVGLAGWYKYSPQPGVIGPSIILGHIDSAQYGKGVFFDLGKLHGGDKVAVDRADGMVALYRVTKVAEYPKSHFPTQTIYGDTAKSTVRLITCGGAFDAAARNYVDNIVAFGTLVSLTRG